MTDDDLVSARRPRNVADAAGAWIAAAAVPSAAMKA
jgi:hypothetical protein